MNEAIIVSLIGTIVSLLLATVKNEKSKAKVRKACLNIYRTIGNLYISDPDFQPAMMTVKATKVRKKTKPVRV